MKKSLAFLSGICLALSSGLASAVTLNGWNVGNPTSVGAAGLVNATKNVGGVAKVSNASIVPNASQVSKILRGGVAGVALTVAVNELLDGVDWVMDPANNQIRYNEKKLYEGYSFYNPNNVNDADDEGFATPYLAAKNYYTYWCNQGNSNYCGNYTFTCPTEISSSIRCTLDQDNSRGITLFPKKNSAEFEEKTLPLDTVSQKVIDKAETGNTDAQEATVAATQDILNEAQNDAEKAKPIVQQLEDNSTNADPNNPDPDDEKADQAKIDQVLKNTTARPATKGRARQYDKNGGINQANADFDSMALSNIRNIPNGRMGKMKDGTMVNVRSTSSGKEPTLEIQIPKKPIKIRYN